MDKTGTANTTFPQRGIITYVMGAITVLTCPCHLPGLLLLLSGTAAGSFLSQNLGIAIMLLLPVFLLSAIATWLQCHVGLTTELLSSLPLPPRWADASARCGR